MINEDVLRAAKLRIPEGLCLSVILPDKKEILVNLSSGAIFNRKGVHLLEDDPEAEEIIRKFVRTTLFSYQLKQAQEGGQA